MANDRFALLFPVWCVMRAAAISNKIEEVAKAVVNDVSAAVLFTTKENAIKYTDGHPRPGFVPVKLAGQLDLLEFVSRLEKGGTKHVVIDINAESIGGFVNTCDEIRQAIAADAGIRDPERN